MKYAQENMSLWCHMRELEVWEMILCVVTPCVHTWSLSEWTIAAVIFLILPTVRGWFCLILISWNCLYFVPRRQSPKPSAVAFCRNKKAIRRKIQASHQPSGAKLKHRSAIRRKIQASRRRQAQNPSFTPAIKRDISVAPAIKHDISVAPAIKRDISLTPPSSVILATRHHRAQY